MAKFLVTAAYTPLGLKGIIATGGTARRDAVHTLVAGLGGQVESLYFGLGDLHAYVTMDLPDPVTATAIAMAVSASGMAVVQTTALLTPEELDQAAATAVDFTPAGG